MNLKDKWEFSYTADVLADAAQKKLEYHTGRLAFWKDEHEKKLAQIKERGLKVHEHVGAVGSMANNFFATSNSYAPPAIAIDSEMQQHLHEAQLKVNEHRNLVKAYEGWADALESQGKSTFKLDHSDWLFFFSNR